MGRISEFEPREREVRRRARRSWPVSARFAIGTMVALNLILIAFLVKSEFMRSQPVEAPATVKADVPRVEPQPLGNIAPVQNSRPEVEGEDVAPASAIKADAALAVDSKPEIQTSHPQRIATPPRLSGKSNALVTKPATVATKPRVEATNRYNPAPAQQTRFAAPQIQSSRVPVPMPAVVAAPVPPPSSGIVNTPPAVASVRAPVVGVQNNADTHQKVIAPASTTAKKAQPAINPVTGEKPKPPVRVASVGLPSMDKGLIVPKMAADSASPKIQIVRRPTEPKVNVPNCGGDVLIPCPTLKKRPAGGTPERDRW